MNDYVLVVCKDIDKARQVVSEMKLTETEPLLREVRDSYTTPSKKVDAVAEGMNICGLQHKGKRPDKALVYGDVDKQWMTEFVYTALSPGGKVILQERGTN